LKPYFFIFFVLIILNIFATERTVKLDGSGDFSSIQSAVDASQNGDIITVYPGDYRENINIGSKSLSLQSLYAYTPDTLYIHTTRIIGQPSQSAIRAENSLNLSINGFTIMNNENQIEEYYWVSGGGLFLFKSNVCLKNNIVTHCISGYGGGGITIASSSYERNVSLENNKIFYNKTYGGGGGIVLSGKLNVSFSSTSKNSIYNNSSKLGKDIYSSTETFPLNIILKKGSVPQDHFDQYFISVSHDLIANPSPVSVSIEEGALTLVNHDLYVAPWGDDNNSGLDVQNPLRSIDYATKIIVSDSLNPKTVYLAEGIYSYSANQQNFPFSIKSATRLIGAGMHESIIDAERLSVSINGSTADRNAMPYHSVHFEKFCFRNGGNLNMPDSNNSPLSAYANHITIKDVLIENNQYDSWNGISLINFENAYLKNIIVRTGQGMSSSTGLFVYQGNQLVLEDCVFDSLNVLNDQGGYAGIWIWDLAGAVFNNVSIRNCSAYSPVMFQYVKFADSPHNVSRDSYLNNLFFVNNTSTSGDWDSAKIGLLDEWGNTFHLNNFTVAHNRGSSTALGISSHFTMNNMILYNPEMPTELRFGNGVNHSIQGEINYSMIMNRNSKISYQANPANLQMSQMIDADNPGFRGMSDPNLSLSAPEYYYLYPGSPCIDSGTPDTSGYYLSETDMAGYPRIYNERIDLGCFEYNPNVSEDDQTVSPVLSYNLQNYPNPVSLGKQGFTIVSFDYPQEVRNEPEIEIFNIKGQKVRTLKMNISFSEMNTNKADNNSRNYSVIWDTRNDQGQKVASGIFLYRAKVNGRVLQNKKMLILK